MQCEDPEFFHEKPGFPIGIRKGFSPRMDFFFVAQNDDVSRSMASELKRLETLGIPETKKMGRQRGPTRGEGPEFVGEFFHPRKLTEVP